MYLVQKTKKNPSWYSSQTQFEVPSQIVKYAFELLSLIVKSIPSVLSPVDLVNFVCLNCLVYYRFHGW